MIYKVFPNFTTRSKDEETLWGKSTKTSKILLSMAPTTMLGRRPVVPESFFEELGIDQGSTILKRTCFSKNNSSLVQDEHTLLPFSQTSYTGPHIEILETNGEHSAGPFISKETLICFGTGGILYSPEQRQELHQAEHSLIPPNTPFTIAPLSFVLFICTASLEDSTNPLSESPLPLHNGVSQRPNENSTHDVLLSTNEHEVLRVTCTDPLQYPFTKPTALFQLSGSLEVTYKEELIDVIYPGEERYITESTGDILFTNADTLPGIFLLMY